MRIEEGYFQWLVDKVCHGNFTDRRKYMKLMRYLHYREFDWLIGMDQNRAEDGLYLRELYSDECNPEFDSKRTCSVFEMMIALSMRMEEFMDDIYCDRTGEWFWSMVINLGLNSMDDEHYDEVYISDAIDRLLNRDYAYNGAGGLFTIYNRPEKDMRDEEIWKQMCFRINDILN